MKNMTAAETIEAMKSMTTDERIAFLMANRPDAFQPVQRVASFGKAPKGGWTDADKVK